jgi:hypothetical protein
VDVKKTVTVSIAPPGSEAVRATEKQPRTNRTAGDV